jgi:diacylglycerol O-acyltransferase
MAEGHADRLGPLDAAFLAMETPTQYLHGGGLFLFDASQTDGFDFTRFLALVRSRIHQVPRYRQKLAFAPLNLATPAWVDDAQFDIAYHVRHAALPRPGTMAQLLEYAGRILSRPLDRDRPLWELYVVEGLADDRFAVLAKSHQALVDGVAAVDIVTVMFDRAPDTSAELPPPEPWVPRPPPSGYELARSGVAELARSPAAAVSTGRRLAAAPAAAARRALTVGRGLASVVGGNLLRPAPRSLLNVAPGPHRRFALQRLSLADVQRVKNVFDTTVNDVVLAVTADATGRYLRSRGARTDRLWLRAMVPMSVRTDDDEHVLGNRVVAVFANLPMFEMDPVERLHVCGEEMKEVAASQHAAGAGFLIGMTQFSPPTIHAMAARVAARGRLFNFAVANVPGPQVPIYCLGARLVGGFPFLPLAGTHAYAVGVTSIDGWMNVGLTADYDGLPDLDNVPDYLASALADLVASADALAARHELVERSRRRAQETIATHTRLDRG